MRLLASLELEGEDPLSPQPEFFYLVTGGPLGQIHAGLPLHGFNAVMQYRRIVLSHTLNVEC